MGNYRGGNIAKSHLLQQRHEASHVCDAERCGAHPHCFCVFWESLASELKLFRPLDYDILPYRGHVIGSLGEGLLQCTGESYPHTSSCFPPFRDLVEPIDVGIIDKWSLIGILLYLNIPLGQDSCVFPAVLIKGDHAKSLLHIQSCKSWPGHSGCVCLSCGTRWMVCWMAASE